MCLLILYGFIVGIIIGYLSKYFLLCKYFYIYKGPNSKDIVGNIFEFNKKYYKFKPLVCVCPL